MSNGSLEQSDGDIVSEWEQRCLSEILLRSGDYGRPAEKRVSVRYAASGDGFIETRLGKPLHCTLVDRSEGGARLKVLSVLGIPDEFVLTIAGERLNARIAWRSPSELGVAFVPA